MEDKWQEIWSQYDIRVTNRYRCRSGLVFAADQGLFLLRPYRGSGKELESREKIKNLLVEKGCSRVDLAVKTEKEEYLAQDRYHNLWMLYRWSAGEECESGNPQDLVTCAEHLGYLHTLLQTGEETGEAEWQRQQSRMDVADQMERHTREMQRIRRYIRGKHRKNEIEICLLHASGEAVEQAGRACSILGDQDLDPLWQRSRCQTRICHGHYSYHQVLKEKEGLFTGGFDHAKPGLQVRDLHEYLQKVMEKNEWDDVLLEDMVRAYESRRVLEEEEKYILYAMLLYPSKYWKLMNGYFHGSKTWIQGKSMEKYRQVMGQEQRRQACLDKIPSILWG